MDERPETRYVAIGDADVAYQVLGTGPRDLLYFYGLGSHIDFLWDGPAAEFMRRLASFSRLILFDRRGTGASHGVSAGATPTWEEWTEDLGAVLDAAASERAAILAVSDAGPLAILFAASHPERVSGLILINTTARYLIADDYPVGRPPKAVDAIVETVGSTWGTPDLVRAIAPSMADDEDFVNFLAKVARAVATPRMAAAQYRYILSSLDVRRALPFINAPTLVLHVGQSRFLPLEQGRYVADHVAGARFVELPGGDIGFTPHNYALVDEVAEFLTGQRPMVKTDRILTTVLVTDIVRSTELAASIGDQRWHTLLDRHDRTVRDQLRRFRGREINTTGDGFIASFDGPARAVRCAQATIEASRKLGIELRAGAHTGECEIRGDDLGGLAVHIAARVGALANPGEILVSGTVKDLVVGSGIEFVERGEHELKGVPGARKLFAPTT
jgi:class 3 adenylate cyclase/pimeloyl-ACP methyl ester carboxylesterase